MIKRLSNNIEKLPKEGSCKECEKKLALEVEQIPKKNWWGNRFNMIRLACESKRHKGICPKDKLINKLISKTILLEGKEEDATE